VPAASISGASRTSVKFSRAGPQQWVPVLLFYKPYKC